MPPEPSSSARQQAASSDRSDREASSWLPEAGSSSVPATRESITTLREARSPHRARLAPTTAKPFSPTPLMPSSALASDQGHAHLSLNGELTRSATFAGAPKIESTVCYLGVEVDDALEIAVAAGCNRVQPMWSWAEKRPSPVPPPCSRLALKNGPSLPLRPTLSPVPVSDASRRSKTPYLDHLMGLGSGVSMTTRIGYGLTSMCRSAALSAFPCANRGLRRTQPEQDDA